MATKITLNFTSILILVLVSHSFFILSFCSIQDPMDVLKGIDVGHPTIDVSPIPIQGSSKGSKDAESCQRVPVHGISRTKLQSYAKAYRVMLVPSVVIPDKWHSRIQICFHGNASLGLCQCEKDDWRSIYKGLWSSLMSPYEQRFVDVKFVDGVSGSVTVTLDEVSQGWRYILLAGGIALLFSAPTVSNWVPFYYTSSMAIGVLAVVLILLYQGMKLLPTGRKSAFYLSMYTSLLGAGSFLVHYVAMFVNSILANFGFSQEMQNPVSVFLLLLIILLGASLGYWLVRKYIISEDGDVDEGVAQFIKWAMRVIAVTSIFLSSIDTPLAMVAVGSPLALYYAISSIQWRNDDMAESSDSRRKGTGVGKRAGGSYVAATTEPGSIPNPPCGACKFLRRKCVNGYIFAPYFGSDQGAARFAAVHKVFGASNVSELLMHIPANRRQHAVVTISYEAQARLSDPVYGCVSIVLALQQQVAALQTELAMVQNQLINNKLLVANAIQSSQQQLEPMHHLSLLQPAYSNASSASNNNMLNMNSFDSGLNNLADDHHSAALSQQSFNPLQLCQPCHDDEDDDKEESGDPLAFANQMLQSR